MAALRRLPRSLSSTVRDPAVSTCGPQFFLKKHMTYQWRVLNNILFSFKLSLECKKVQNVYSNLYSQAVTHPSTNRSQPCLTSVIGRELVYSRWYGRRHRSSRQKLIAWSKSAKQLKESCLDEGHSCMFCFTLMPLSADLVGHLANLGQSWTIN